MTIQSYKDLIVWQKSVDLSIEVYKCTSNLPKEEEYGLKSQMRRAAVSIPSNIAEGRSRSTRKDFIQFLRIAMGSIAELQTQTIICNKLNYLNTRELTKIEDMIIPISKMLHTLINKLSNT